MLIPYAEFVAPQGDPLYVSGDTSQTLIQMLDWSSDPAILGAFVATVLIAETLGDLNRALVENPNSAKLRVDLPRADELRAYLEVLTRDIADFSTVCEVPREVLADKLVGLSRVNVRALVLRAVANKERITAAYLTGMKKELIEKEASGRLEFLESTRTLDDVAGHVEAKTWLRQDAVLLRRGLTRAIPMGYLLTGRIGTGKTYLVECLAGEIGVPCVELKNFREKWVGATEGNLEKVFNILHALGQVIVFVDEADQAMGKRGGGDGDSGLSGRIYAMMAEEMCDTRNRGKIVWIFATSRPDLLEVDLKRQGRLDVHIPLFPPRRPAGAARRCSRRWRASSSMEIKPDGAAVACPTTTRSAATRWRGSSCARCASTRRRARPGTGPGPAGPPLPRRPARLHRRGDRRLPAVGAHRAARADGPAGGQGVHRRPLPARALPLPLDRRRQHPHPAPQAGNRGVGAGGAGAPLRSLAARPRGASLPRTSPLAPLLHCVQPAPRRIGSTSSSHAALPAADHLRRRPSPASLLAYSKYASSRAGSVSLHLAHWRQRRAPLRGARAQGEEKDKNVGAPERCAEVTKPLRADP